MDSTYNINIEKSVLSAILYDPQQIDDILDILNHNDFYLEAHQKIFEAMQTLHNNSLPIDEEFIRKKVNSKDVSDEILIEILGTNPIANIKAYSNDIKDSAIKRRLASLSTLIKKVSQEEDTTAVDAVDSVQNELYKITTDNISSEVKNIDTISNETLDYIKLMKQMGNKHLIGQTTGFYKLDKETTGFNPGDLIIIGARPAMGKTALVLNTALKNIQNDKGVIIFSLEMPSNQLMLRILSAKTSIPLQKLRKGDLDDNQWSILTNAFDDLSSKKLFIDDGGSLNINQIRARVRKLVQNQENNISMVIIDYLQLMQGTSSKDRHLEVSEISRGLKMLAREMNIPIVALSQLNRGLESRPDKRPMLSDLRESGSIEQDADIIMFVYRDDVYKERDEKRKEKEAKDKGESYKSAFVNKEIEEAEIIIGKQRSGPIGTIKLDFHKKFTRFVDKENDFNAPIETIYQNIADEQKDTQFEMPEIL